MSVFKRSICLLIVIFTVLTAFSCKGSNSGGAVTEPVNFELGQSFTVVRPSERDLTEIEALQLVCRGIESAYGFEPAYTTDRDGDTGPKILIGETDHPESKAIAQGLGFYDWEYRIVSTDAVVICGGSAEATLNAARAFLLDIFGYEESSDGVVTEGKGVTLTVGVGKTYRHSYPVDSIKLGSRDLLEYRVVAQTPDATGLKTLLDGFSRLLGYAPEAVTPEEYKGGPAIFFGMTSPDGSHFDREIYGNKRFFIDQSGENIIIDFKSTTVAEAAAERFLSEYLPKNPGKTVNVSLKNRRQISEIFIKNGTNSLRLASSVEKRLAEGINYIENLYRDADGLPVRAYILTVERGAGTVATSMPRDSSVIGTVSNMKNQVNAAVNNGKNVIAGINADFFDMGNTNVMTGLCIKDGVELHGARSRPWFGITSDGRAVMGTSDEYESYKGKLVSAVGGSDILLKNDNQAEALTGSDFADTRHPRTAVGVMPDGTVVLMVVDGRQPLTSNGASLSDLAQMLSALGCSDAINLDGGGSSTFILRENGQVTVENSPSGVFLRAVANGLLVIVE